MLASPFAHLVPPQRHRVSEKSLLSRTYAEFVDCVERCEGRIRRESGCPVG